MSIENLKTPLYEVRNGVTNKLLVETSADQCKLTVGGTATDVEAVLGGVLSGSSIATGAGITHDENGAIVAHINNSLFINQNDVNNGEMGVNLGGGLTNDESGKVMVKCGGGVAIFGDNEELTINHDNTLYIDEDTGSLGVAIGDGLNINPEDNTINCNYPVVPLAETVTIGENDWDENKSYSVNIEGIGGYEKLMVIHRDVVTMAAGISHTVADDTITFTYSVSTMAGKTANIYLIALF